MMDNDPIYESVAADLKVARGEGAGALELARLAKGRLGVRFGALSFIATFKMAFGIPVEVLHRAHAWEGFNLGQVGISDAEFESLLSDWIPVNPEGS
ncbi:hypothetical protein [Streptomyces noursei]|nr:hypothetical protein [Streptomyces noursei]UWS73477.1 hypothetical protein N1H47_20850 [Streptomyces noursei]